jgi:hypothetical protein
MTKTAIFVFSGNCRTFIECFDSAYDNIISQLFSNDYNIYLYLYLKLTDPGPKGQDGWNFKYEDIEHDVLIKKINVIKNDYSNLNIEYKLLDGNELSDNEIMSQVKDRTLYKEICSNDNILLRALHCHYNFEKCGEYILEKEKLIQSKFDYIIYIRPDLFFVNRCDNIDMYNKSIVTLGVGPNKYNNDHIAIIPRHHLNNFFFDRFNVYRNNTQRSFITPEEVYWHTINYEVKQIGQYYIKRIQNSQQP